MMKNNMKKICGSKIDLQFKQIFNASPECYLIITPDIPQFTIIGVTDAYLESTRSQRENIVGRSIYELFSDNPSHKTLTAISFQRVLDNNCADEMGIIKHHILTASEGKSFEERTWNAVNYPVIGVDGKVAYIIHKVVDVKNSIPLEKKENKYPSINLSLH